MAFSGAQTFLVDPSVVSGATEINLTKVRFFFKAKPDPVNNQSGIQNPGVTVFVVPTLNGVPDITAITTMPSARCEYEEVQVSSDATLPTDFVFEDLPSLATGYEYAAVVAFDGNDDFILWKSVLGERLLGTTNTPSPGSSGQYVGKWFEFVSNPPSANGNSVANSGIAAADQNQSAVADADALYIQDSWRPLNSTDLKFTVFCARYAINGSANLTPIATANTLVPASAVIHNPSGNVTVSLANGTVAYLAPSARYEYVAYDYSRSKTTGFRNGERAWQVRPYYPDSKTPTTVAVTANSSRVTTSMNFNDLYDVGLNPEYIVVVSENHGGGATRHDVREVNSIEANGVLIVTEPFSFTNAAAYFYKPPVGFVDTLFPAKVGGNLTDLLILRDSNANSAVRFVNNSIQSVTVVAGGTGYSNTDYVTFTGFENVATKVVGGYSANAKLVTNSTGGITQVYMANQGAGFVNTSAIVVAVTNSTGGSTGGSGANLVANVGMTVASEYSYVPSTEGYVKATELINPNVGDIVMDDEDLVSPLGSFLNTYLRLAYYRVAASDTLAGWTYHLDDDNSDNDFFHVTPGERSLHRFKKERVLPSWSNELIITYGVSGVASNGNGTAANNLSNNYSLTSNASVVTIVAASNNDFTVVRPGQINFVFSRYQINDDYTGEEGNYGNASAKGISNKVTFANGVAAEDIRVFLTAWKPANTDIKVYVKIHNSQDIDAFDDKEWTLLKQTSGFGLVSSQSDESDLVELGYGFSQWPNTAFTANGSVTTQSGNAVVVGSNTLFQSEVSVGDLVRVYSPLFSNTNHEVFLVTTVTSNTQITLNRPVTNNNIIGVGMKVDKLGYKHQAFNNIMNDNIVRYYNSVMAEYDTYNTMQVKIVMLADQEDMVPKIDSTQVVGVTA